MSRRQQRSFSLRKLLWEFYFAFQIPGNVKYGMKFYGAMVAQKIEYDFQL